MTGPFETERQAEDSVRHILDSRSEAWRDGNRRLMEDACTAAGVELGAWDHRILLWLANYESSTCAVIAGLMTRVHQASAALTASQLATVLDALDVAADYKRDRAATCPDCESSLAELCGTCEWRLARADEYDALAGALQRHLGRASDRGDRPVAGDSTDETVAGLEHDWPDWQIWVVPRAVGGMIWCARRWDDEKRVLNAGSPEELVELLEEAAGQ